MKKYINVLLLLCMIFLTACGRQETPKEEDKSLKRNQIYVYLTDLDRTGLVSRVYTLDQDSTLTQNVDSLVRYLTEALSDEEGQSPVPEGITYVENHLEQRRGRLAVSFDVAYDKIDADSMLFFKACVTKTLLQLEGVDAISLSLTDIANTNEETATVVEYLDSDSFVLSFGKNSGYKQSGTIILYFANETGEALKEYRKIIEISNNTSLARIVVESLIEGPERDGYQATLSDETTIRNISVKDGICYVDLSDEFYNADNPLRNDIIVYSVVNSLVELPTISKVQFLKNGEKQSFFRETMEFDGIFERNLDLIEQEETEE